MKIQVAALIFQYLLKILPLNQLNVCYMYFFEQQIRRQINNRGGLYFRYIDDIFLMITWPKRHLLK